MNFVLLSIRQASVISVPAKQFMLKNQENVNVYEDTNKHFSMMILLKILIISFITYKKILANSFIVLIKHSRKN